MSTSKIGGSASVKRNLPPPPTPCPYTPIHRTLPDDPIERLRLLFPDKTDDELRQMAGEQPTSNGGKRYRYRTRRSRTNNHKTRKHRRNQHLRSRK